MSDVIMEIISGCASANVKGTVVTRVDFQTGDKSVSPAFCEILVLA